jgi:hypothetical protein
MRQGWISPLKSFATNFSHKLWSFVDQSDLALAGLRTVRPEPTSWVVGTISKTRSSRRVNFDTIAERVTEEEALPGNRWAILYLHSGSFQPGFQTIHIPAPKAEMPLRVHPRVLFLD